MATPFIGSFSARPQVALDTSRIQELGADRTTLENMLKQRQLGIAQAQMVGDVSSNLARTVNQQRLMEPEIERLNRTLDTTVEKQNMENQAERIKQDAIYQSWVQKYDDFVKEEGIRQRTAANVAELGGEIFAATRKDVKGAAIHDAGTRKTDAEARHVATTERADSGALVDAYGEGIVSGAKGDAPLKRAQTAQAIQGEQAIDAEQYALDQYAKAYPENNYPGGYPAWKQANMAWASYGPSAFKAMTDQRAAAKVPVTPSLRNSADSTRRIVKVFTGGGKRTLFDSDEDSELSGGKGEAQRIGPDIELLASKYGMKGLIPDRLMQQLTTGSWVSNETARNLVPVVHNLFVGMNEKAVSAALSGSPEGTFYTPRGLAHATEAVQAIHGSATKTDVNKRGSTVLIFEPTALMPDQLEVVVQQANAASNPLVDLARLSPDGKLPDPGKLPETAKRVMVAGAVKAAGDIGLSPTDHAFSVFSTKFARTAYALAEARTMSEREVGSAYDAKSAQFGAVLDNIERRGGVPGTAERVSRSLYPRDWTPPTRGVEDVRPRR